MTRQDRAISRWWNGFLAGLAALALAGPALAADFPTEPAKLYDAAKAEGSLTWYVGGPLEGMNAIAREFEKQYPGIKIQTMRLVGVAQYQKYMDETNAGKNIADVLQNTDYPSMHQLVDDGHIVAWKVPTFDRIEERFRIKDFAYAQYTSTSAIIYNVNKAKPEEIKMLEGGWQALLDPRFKGRLSISTMKCGVCYAPVHLWLDPKLKDTYGADFIRKLAAQQPAIYSEVLVSVDRVVAGEQDFAVSGWEAAGALKLIEGAPVRWVFPKPAPEFGNSWLGVSAHAPHPNASRLFLDWLVGDEGQMAMERVYGSKGTLSGIKDQRPYVHESWYHEPAEIYPIDWARWDTNYHTDMDLFAKILKQAQQ